MFEWERSICRMELVLTSENSLIICHRWTTSFAQGFSSGLPSVSETASIFQGGACSNVTWETINHLPTDATVLDLRGDQVSCPLFALWSWDVSLFLDHGVTKYLTVRYIIFVIVSKEIPHVNLSRDWISDHMDRLCLVVQNYIQNVLG